MARVATEVVKLNDTPDGTVVVVRVTSLAVIPDEFQELRARARALTATGFASSATGLLDDVELGEIDRLTQTQKERHIKGGNVRETKEYTVKVDTPF